MNNDSNKTKTSKKRSTAVITKIIAKCFATQPILKAWLFGSFARGEQNSKDFKDTYPETPWSVIQGMRHLLCS